MTALPPASHRNDPWTSRVAERAHKADRRKNIDRVLAAVTERPGLTADDIATITGLDVYETRRRLSDLKNTGKLQQGPAVRQGNRPVVTWLPREVPA